MPRARFVRLCLPVVFGLVVGLSTAVLQQHLGRPWQVLANSPSPWLTAMFATGALFSRPLAGTIGGLVGALSELAGYYAGVLSFDWPFLHGRWVLLWLSAGLIAGPVFGWAGSRWFRGRRLSGFSSALLPAAWFTEALVLFVRYHATGPAELFVLVGIGVALVLGGYRRQYLGVAMGTIVALPLGVLGEVALAAVYRWLL